MSKKPTTTSFETVDDIIVSLTALLRPAEELSVAQAAEKYRYVNQPGAYVGPWLNTTTMYLVEPMNTFTSREFEGIAFCGPAQCGKTDGLVINTISYAVVCEPMDTMLVCPTNTAARDFSMRRIDRLHRHSEAVGNLLLRRADADNTFDKHYSNGMLLSLSWPTPTELAGKPIGRIVMTDFDRMDDDVGGDGNPYDLASMRTTTFGSYAMTLAESSPSKPITNPKWIAVRPHEAPPTTGILALYNRGDMRRWYWPCPHCGEYFEGKFSMLRYPEEGSNLERARGAWMACPMNGCVIQPDEREEMNLWGRWLKSGESIDRHGRKFGEGVKSAIASFWLFGVAASFTSWPKLVRQFLDATDDYTRTLSEEALKKFYNNSLGEPYYPQALSEMRLPEVLKSRAEKGLQRGLVPLAVRFLVANVDVQKNMFVVQVHGIIPGAPFDMVVIDRFQIRKSKRKDEDGDTAWVKPAAYLEDWDLITEHVIDREYEIDDGSGRMMSIKITSCDSGGKAGVTGKAYDYYRRLKAQNKHKRFILTKGEHTPGAPRTRISTPDSSRRDAKAVARGDVPVLMIHSNTVKDMLDGRLDCVVPGRGMYIFPDWLEDWWFGEMCAESRGPKGWTNPNNARNETWDLSYYCIGVCISDLIRIEHINWEQPPNWAAPIDMNSFVRQQESAPIFAQKLESAPSFADLGKALA
jgi:phage terminase large subunit GpA-like protein